MPTRKEFKAVMSDLKSNNFGPLCVAVAVVILDVVVFGYQEQARHFVELASAVIGK